MVTLHFGAWITLGYFWSNGAAFFLGDFMILDWACLIIIAGCLQTIFVRLRRIMAALRAKST